MSICNGSNRKSTCFLSWCCFKNSDEKVSGWRNPKSQSVLEVDEVIFEGKK
jgi:hypothetical protein